MLRVTLSVVLMAALAPAAANGLPNRPVNAVDLERYAGQWHEMAHLPMFFQRKCVANITATYTPSPDGTIKVYNACRSKDGSMQASDGVARKVAGQAGALKVRFAPAWLSWIPMVWADYWIVELDPDYQWAVVGGPSRKYLWVLSRKPTMKRELFDQIKARAYQRGYAVEKLVLAAPVD
jgi:apolipoprotein D and lipocalin family protein